MHHIHSKPGSSVRRTGLWLGIVMLLGGVLGITSLTAGQNDRPRYEPVVAQAAVAPPQMSVRSPDDAVVGRRFTLEVIITNPTSQPMRGLEFVAEFDANLEQDSKARAHLEKIDTVAVGTPHIVRMFVTPTKKGPARVDIILRSKNGQMLQVQHVMPVFAADDAPPEPQRPADSSPLQVSFTSPKECFADQPATFLIHILNTGTQPTRDRMELMVAYGTLSNPNVFQGGAGFGPGGPGFNGGGGFGGRGMKGGMMIQANPTNPVRETKLILPSLAPNESRTIPVTLTPRRIGQFCLNVTAGKQTKATEIKVRFDPNVSVNDMLPTVKGDLIPRLPRTLAEVIEVGLEDRVSKTLKADEAFEHVAHMMDKVNFANVKKVDAFAAALLEKRADMNGMPMAMGDSCRLKPQRANEFISELTMLRMHMAQHPNGHGLVNGLNQMGQQGAGRTPSARIAAMMQVLGPETVQMRTEMIKHLATLSDAEATQALANLAVFSPEEQVRQASIDALKTRREKDYSDILVRNLDYPWPEVAQNASQAIVKLKRTDLIPQLVATLERPDPRAPQAREGKQVVREMVKINHLRNCMLCHPPRSGDQNLAFAAGIGGEGKGQQAVLVAQVPIPNQPLPVSPGNGGGYGSFSVPETLVRFDVTYLRQDFSVMLPVADHQPWPQTQRFDFLVRTREVNEQEAQTYRDLLRPAGTGSLSPYQRAAVAALRDLTGRDTEPTGPAWRRLLEQIRADG